MTSDRESDKGQRAVWFMRTAGVMFSLSAVLLFWQIQNGVPESSPDNQFSRVFVTGFSAMFTSALLSAVLDRRQVGAARKNVYLAGNFLLVAVGTYLIANGIWR